MPQPSSHEHAIDGRVGQAMVIGQPPRSGTLGACRSDRSLPRGLQDHLRGRHRVRQRRIHSQHSTEAGAASFPERAREPTIKHQVPRDDFKQNVVRRLAMRAAYVCSNPDCLALTLGPQLGSADGTVNLGVAAHITAAAAGGPRYDLSISPAERSSIANGIWLCQNCAKLIDSDPQHFDVATLHRWKVQHTTRIADTLAGRQASQDQRRVAEIAAATGQPTVVLESILPVPPDVTDELSLAVDVRFVPTRDEIWLQLTFTNLGPQTELTAASLKVGPTDVPFDFGMKSVSTHTLPVWDVSVNEDGGLLVPIPGDAERIVTLVARHVAARGDIFTQDDDWWRARVSVTVGTKVIERDCLLLSNRGAARTAEGKKLRPLRQWLCDQCGLPILQAKDGWVEWTMDRSSKLWKSTGFRIVHHFIASPRRAPRGCYGDKDELTTHLHHVIDEGVSWGLELLGVGEPGGLGSRQTTVADLTEWAVLVRRLWLPFYEQARHYIERGVREDVVHLDSSFYAPDVLERIIEHYVSRELAPEPGSISEFAGGRLDAGQLSQP